MPIGVLALQGDVREHINLLTELGSTAVEVRTVEQPLVEVVPLVSRREHL